MHDISLESESPRILLAPTSDPRPQGRNVFLLTRTSPETQCMPWLPGLITHRNSGLPFVWDTGYPVSLTSALWVLSPGISLSHTHLGQLGHKAAGP